ncbi:Dynamitin-domain-containing protein [Stachybotrys elegans]|uniref:Dynamitin-domain-containing protein n=1 Tax=Stachybotrys elegans TaxID=80388 RepID=A0A8K0WVC6_9HYPO|nr:Dynamitin-domain-containing protein [Stachybotrys elegans]
MALNRKYAALPDLDSAPDIYETPDLTDDNSTLPTTAARNQSDDEFYDIEEDDEAQPISRSRLRIDEARSRFLPAHAEPAGGELADRFDWKRKAYKVSGRRQHILEDGTEEYGDLTDDEDEAESFERKIARLKREVLEAKEYYAQQETSRDAAGESKVDLDSLSQVLDNISGAPRVTKSLGAPKSAPAAADAKDSSQPQAGSGPTYTLTYTPTYEQSHALAKAADFDRRLLALERGLGIGASSIPEAGDNGLPRAILPTLDAMEKQLSTLAQASTANLDAISRRVRTLASEQEKLNESREKAKALREELGKHAPPPPPEEGDQEAKVNALYAILPSIEKLTPMLPPLLDRLRSLRAIHADAAAASQTLERVESQQTDMTAELKQWREGLEKMEAAMRQGDSTVQGNLKTMQGWVKDLEERMKKLA